jgi:hypothetical protein
MSGEFGSYLNGYFWYQMKVGALDCLDGDKEITKLWGEFLNDFSEIAHAIAWCEAGDSGVDYPIRATMAALPRLKIRLADIEKYLEPFQKVAEEAVKLELEKKEKERDNS